VVEAVVEDGDGLPEDLVGLRLAVTIRSTASSAPE